MFCGENQFIKYFKKQITMRNLQSLQKKKKDDFSPQEGIAKVLFKVF